MRGLRYVSVLQTQVSAGITAIGFWLGVVLPLIYVPLLIFSNLNSWTTIQTFGMLLGLHVTSLLLGRQYN